MAGKLSLRAPLRERIKRLLVLPGFVPHPGAPIDADDGAALEQDQVERNLRNLAGGKADHEMAASPSERAQGRLAVGAADGIEHHVDAVLSAEPLERLAQILLRVVDDFIGPMG